MSIQVLNPTHEGDFKSFKAAEGLKSLKGAKVGIISNGKKGTFHFFNALEELLIKNHGVKKVIRVVKKNYRGLRSDTAIYKSLSDFFSQLFPTLYQKLPKIITI